MSEGTCGSNCGITRARERQKAAARALVRVLYPYGFRARPAWSPDDRPFTDDEIEGLARAFEDVLPCRALVVRATSEHESDWIHVVATMGEGSWVALREGVAGAPETASETSLRVGLSPFGRYATLQEVRVRGQREEGGWWVEEDRVVGVEDKRLQTFVKAIQGMLRKRDIVALDAAFLAEPVEDPDGEGNLLTGESPTLWTALFDRDPAATRTGMWVTERG